VENLFGGHGCALPDGSLCDFSCTALKVNVNGVIKPDSVPCPKLANPGGCSLQGTPEKPIECQDYHCGKDPAYNHLSLIAGVAIRSGRLSSEVISYALRNSVPRLLV
jgi:hypothetical protein